MSPKDEAPVVPVSPSSEDRIAAVLEKMVQLEENKPIQQIPVTKVKHVTAFNPEGKPDHLRAKLKRSTYMNGYQIHESTHTEEEINLLNQLTAGHYQNRQWHVVTQDGEGESAVFLYVPNKTVADRIKVATDAGSLVNICKLIIAEAKANQK